MPPALQFLVLTVAGWMNRHQEDLIDYLREENRAIYSRSRSLTVAGLRRYLVFFVIELQSRRVAIAGIHPQRDGPWMKQVARNLTDPVDGVLRTARHLIHDRDPLYTRRFAEILTSGGVQPVRLACAAHYADERLSPPLR